MVVRDMWKETGKARGNLKAGELHKICFYANKTSHFPFWSSQILWKYVVKVNFKGLGLKMFQFLAKMSLMNNGSDGILKANYRNILISNFLSLNYDNLRRVGSKPLIFSETSRLFSKCWYFLEIDGSYKTLLFVIFRNLLIKCNK